MFKRWYYVHDIFMRHAYYLLKECVHFVLGLCLKEEAWGRFICLIYFSAHDEENIHLTTKRQIHCLIKKKQLSSKSIIQNAAYFVLYILGSLRRIVQNIFDEKFKELSEVVLTYLTANTMTAEVKTIMSYHCNYFIFRRCQIWNETKIAHFYTAILWKFLNLHNKI